MGVADRRGRGDDRHRICTLQLRSAKLHSVTDSATTTQPLPAGEVSAAETPDLRAAKRQETARRITVSARRLSVAHGVDGFTMDDLAREAGVSRRTLFNYFPGKDDAVLGPAPEVSPESFAVFVAGGPHGSLVADLAEMVVRILREQAETPEEVGLGREAMRSNPRLISLALEHLQDLVESCIGFVEQREGDAFDRTRFDVALTIVVACLHLAMDRFLTGEHGTDLAPLFTSTLRTAHELLAPPAS